MNKLENCLFQNWFYCENKFIILAEASYLMKHDIFCLKGYLYFQYFRFLSKLYVRS